MYRSSHNVERFSTDMGIRKRLGPASVDDLKTRPSLTDPRCRGGLSNMEVLFSDHRAGSGEDFRFLPDEVLKPVADVASLWSYDEGSRLFDQGQSTANLPLFILLQGECKVRHIYRNYEVIAAIDVPGTVIGDVEFLLRDVEPMPSIRGGLSGKTTWAEIECRTSCDVIEVHRPDVLFESSELSQNLARIMALKLVRRSANADPRMYFSGIDRLRWFVKELANSETVEDDLDREGWRKIHLRKLNQTDIAEYLLLSRQAISTLKSQLEEEGEAVFGRDSISISRKLADWTHTI